MRVSPGQHAGRGFLVSVEDAEGCVGPAMDAWRYLLAQGIDRLLPGGRTAAAALGRRPESLACTASTYVPQSHLARFGQGDMVRVRRRCLLKTHLANAKNVAAEIGFYTITDANGIPSTAIEHELSGLEGRALAALRRIDETGNAAGSRHQRTRAAVPLR